MRVTDVIALGVWICPAWRSGLKRRSTIARGRSAADPLMIVRGRLCGLHAFDMIDETDMIDEATYWAQRGEVSSAEPSLLPRNVPVGPSRP